jgi:hypothetical protein
MQNEERERPLTMSSVNPTKPMVSAIAAIVWLACFAFIDTGSNGFLQSYFHFSSDGAISVKWAAIIIFGLIWLLVQLFMEAPPESSRLSLALSGSILWLGLLLFFNFAEKNFGGAVAFFALVGGLAVVVTWTRYLADEF